MHQSFKELQRLPTTAYVEQISLPMRIALAVTLVFAALWLVVLRPKPVNDPADAPLPATPAKTQSAGKGTKLTDRPAEASKAVDAANAKIAAGEKTADQVGSSTPVQSAPKATSTATAKPAPKTAAATKTATKDVTPTATGAKAVLADLKAGKTVVLLFWAMNVATDDRAVKRAVTKVDRHDGAVRVHTARMSDLPDYEAITKDNPVLTSPTIFVIDRKKQARTITGLTTTREIDSVVARALKVK